jgi:heme-degrading monooxygenase HmoA
MVKVTRTKAHREEPFTMTARITSISDRFGRRIGIDEPMSHLAMDETPTQEAAPSGPIAIYTSYVVSPGDAGLWIGTWTQLARVAETWPGCRSFRILRDRNDAMFVAALSEWDSLEAYSSFQHGAHSMALEQAIGHVCIPSEARFLDVVPVSPIVKTAV